MSFWDISPCGYHLHSRGIRHLDQIPSPYEISLLTIYIDDSQWMFLRGCDVINFLLPCTSEVPWEQQECTCSALAPSSSKNPANLLSWSNHKRSFSSNARKRTAGAVKQREAVWNSLCEQSHPGTWSKFYIRSGINYQRQGAESPFGFHRCGQLVTNISYKCTVYLALS